MPNRPLRIEGSQGGAEGLASSLSCQRLAKIYNGVRLVGTVSFIEPVFEALNAAGARYVVVGGVATVLHGFARLTADIDLIVDLEPTEAKKAIGALVGLGLKPRAPVDAFQFCDPAARRIWIETKGMRVFSLWDPEQPMCEVDLFVETPIPFDELWLRDLKAIQARKREAQE